MSDKLRQSVSVVPEFVDGEQPEAAKLNSIGAQLRRAAEQLEEAVGDIHGESFPYLAGSTTRLSLGWGRAQTSSGSLSGAVERALDISNLGRLVGPSSNLNPTMMGPATPTDIIPVGVHEFPLRYKPAGPITDTQPTFSDTTVFASRKSDASNLVDNGDYHVTGEGKVYTALPTTGGTATYSVDSRLWQGGNGGYTDARFNVLPDPNQIGNGGPGLSFGAKDSQGRYPVTLPVVTHQGKNITGSSIALDSADLNNGYQLEVPKVLVDSFIVGDKIPAGFLFLRNVTTNAFFEDAEYFYNGTTSILVGNVELDDQITAGDSFVFITVGTDITTSIADLRDKAFHTHDRTYGEPFVSLSGITGFLESAGNTGLWVPSQIPGNFAPQYLHRDGYNVGVDNNLNDRNAMRGPLMLGSTVDEPGNNTNISGQSHPIYLCNQDISIQRTAGDNLRLQNNAEDIRLQTTSSAKQIILDAAGFTKVDTSRLVTNKGLIGTLDKAISISEAGTDISASTKRPIHLWSFSGTIDGVVTAGTSFISLDDLKEVVSPTGLEFVSANLLVQTLNAPATSIWQPPNGAITAGYAWQWVWNPSTSNIDISWTGASWPGVSESRSIRGIIYFYEV